MKHYILPVLVTIIALGYFSYPGEKAPWWYSDSQVGWEMDHQEVPQGYDEVSTYIIRSYGMTYLPWKRDKFWSYVGDASTRYEWVGDKLLVRKLDGEESVFQGGGKIHAPLTADPFKEKIPLLQTLSKDDDGKVHIQGKGKSLVEALEESGARVERR